MTDGTSQGLFIVVAIVIFGIFVVLAYILFEDTLSPAMANMFTTATEQATESLKTHTTPASYFTFDKSTNTITSYVGPKIEELRIPSVINGKPVQHIKSNAFNVEMLSPNLQDVKKVVIPNSVLTIGTGAFDNLRFKVLVLGSRVERIENLAFHNAELTELHIPDSIKFIGYEAFRDATIPELSVPNSAIIHNNAFRSSTNIIRK